jgi:peptide/nickel transport system permease protein
LVFLLLRLIPGDVVLEHLGADSTLSQEGVDYLRASFGIDQPLHVQYLRWLGHVLRGDLGVSWRYDHPVLGIILQRLPVTAELTALAMAIAVIVGVTAGTVAALRYNSAVDHAVRLSSLIGMSFPVFWLGSLLILVLSLALHWIPPVDYVGPHKNLWHNLQIMALPATTLGVASAASLMRMTRACVLDVLHQDYIRTASAKGLSRRAVVVRHALRNALIPTITIVGLQTGYIIGGAVVVEEVFTLPGIGRLILQAINARDYPQVQGTILFIGMLLILINLLVDISYAIIDPRVRLT